MSSQNQVVEFKRDLGALIDRKELALPSTVSTEAFRNAAIVAVQDNPGILRCDKSSVFRAIRRLAACGLVPDGNEAAIVPFSGKAQAMPMVRGIIKTARNSGEISSLWAEVVYEGETIDVWIEDGERRFNHKFDPLSRGGDVIGVYAVAKLKDGTVEFESMGKEQIEKRRRASSNQKSPTPTGVWKDWYEEMAKKTAIRSIAKRLPVSSDDMRRIMVEDEANETKFRDVTPESEAERPNLAQRLTGEAQAGDQDDPIDGEVLPPEGDDPTGPDANSFEHDEGRTAANEGKALTECPYEQGTPEWMNWAAGWNSTKEQDNG